MLHVAKSRFASGKGALAAVGIDEVFDVFTLETQYMNEQKEGARFVGLNLFKFLLGDEVVEFDEFKQNTVVERGGRNPMHLRPKDKKGGGEHE